MSEPVVEKVVEPVVEVVEKVVKSVIPQPNPGISPGVSPGTTPSVEVKKGFNWIPLAIFGALIVGYVVYKQASKKEE